MTEPKQYGLKEGDILTRYSYYPWDDKLIEYPFTFVRETKHWIWLIPRESFGYPLQARKRKKSSLFGFDTPEEAYLNILAKETREYRQAIDRLKRSVESLRECFQNISERGYQIGTEDGLLLDKSNCMEIFKDKHELNFIQK